MPNLHRPGGKAGGRNGPVARRNAPRPAGKKRRDAQHHLFIAAGPRSPLALRERERHNGIGGASADAAGRTPYSRILFDLSVALKAGIASDPPSMLPKIEYLDHKQGAKNFATTFPGSSPSSFRTAKVRRSSASPSRPTTAPTSMRLGTSRAPWTAANPPENRSDSAGMVFLGAVSSSTSATNPTAICARLLTSNANSIESATRSNRSTSCW